MKEDIYKKRRQKRLKGKTIIKIQTLDRAIERGR